MWPFHMQTALNRLLLENMHKSTINSCQQLQIHSLPEALAFCKNEDKIINVQKLPAELNESQPCISNTIRWIWIVPEYANNADKNVIIKYTLCLIAISWQSNRSDNSEGHVHIRGTSQIRQTSSVIINDLIPKD